MGRRKIEIKAIKEERNRSVTFLKRKGGLFKKAHELSVLCSVDIAVIIFGSNKKLYEYSSSDMHEILGRYNYYEAPHEHKGPADFQGKGGIMDDDDDDMDGGTPPPEGQDHMMHSHTHMHHPLPHISSRQPTASASPPVHTRNIGITGPYPSQNTGTSQPGHSRPSSRNAVRRVSQPTIIPQNPHSLPQQQSPPTQNGYPYMPVAPQMYNEHGQQTRIQPHMNEVQGYQYNGPQSQYLQDNQRRQSMPPAFPQGRPDGSADNSPPIPPTELQPPLLEPHRAPTKSRSMFTPIVGPDSVLAQHFFPQSQPQSNTRPHSNDGGSVSKSNASPPERRVSPPLKIEDRISSPKPARTSPPIVPPPPAPIEPSQTIPPPVPQRTNSLRPRLTVTIPNEQAEGDAVTTNSSPGGGTSTVMGNPQPPTSRPSDPPPGSVVLPPPSPSVTLLSAGATGPINPFAPRPQTTSGPPPEQTPISALPSRFLSGEMLPSPSTFFSDWNIPFSARNGNGSDNMLPSPLNFQTPVVGSSSHNIFKEDPEISSKRKSPTLDSPEATTAAKKVKV